MSKTILKKYLHNLLTWYRRRKYALGRELSRFVERDVRRDVLIIGNERISEGIVRCRQRNYNLLYMSKLKIKAKPEYDTEVREVHVRNLWRHISEYGTATRNVGTFQGHAVTVDLEKKEVVYEKKADR